MLTLEPDLGGALLERSPRGVTLTPSAEILLAHAREVTSVLLAETVRLELPKVRLRAIDAMSGFIQTWLEDQSIDLGMLYDLSAVCLADLSPVKLVLRP